jgi:hypothetical protein
MLLAAMLAQAALTKRSFDPDEFRKSLHVYQLCFSQEKSNAKIVGLHLNPGPNIPNIELGQSKKDVVFSAGKVVSVEMESDQSRYILTALVKGKMAQADGTLTMVLVGSTPQDQKWTLSLAHGDAVTNFTCVQDIPPPPQSGNEK